jgi:hypothetical protein
MTNPSQQFIVDIYPAAKKVADESGTSLELILAQTAQETGGDKRPSKAPTTSSTSRPTPPLSPLSVMPSSGNAVVDGSNRYQT